MSRYEDRLQRDLTRIADAVHTVSGLVQEALANAVHALLSSDDELASATILGDGVINRAVREIDALCHAFIALHLPGAGHLRWISSVIRVNIELERIGDYAVTMSRESVQLSRQPDGSIAREIALMAEQARAMLKRATDAFDSGNAEAARATMPVADQVGRSFDVAFNDLLADETRPLTDRFGLFVIFNMLERVSDQSKNICEETLFAVTGETKAAKVYRILFLDEDNACQSQLAEALARKMFPGSGEYSSAGRTPAAELRGGLADFLEEHGIDLEGAKPVALDAVGAELANLHVIVSLNGPVKSYVSPVPFHSVALEWDVGPAPEGLDAEATHRRYEELYRDLAERIRSLMVTLRGDEAR